jgi:hypothetical protein
MDISDDPLQTTRDLLDRRATVRHGFLDVLGESVAPDVPTVAQRAMNSVLVAGVYERLWRASVLRPHAISSATAARLALRSAA